MEHRARISVTHRVETGVPMRRLLWLLTCLLSVSLAGCSAEYYARRAALREQRIAMREQQRHARAQQQMMQTCDPQRAFERGHNAGLSRQPMDTSFVAQCPYQMQQQTGTAYMQGYQQGAAIAPQVVMAPRPSPVIVMGGGYAGVGYGGMSQCTFSSDCGSDMHCRRWGNQGNVCMGYGGSGAPCWFGSDCLSGWCDGTGARVCR